MLCSVGYHLFCCHRSEKTSRRWLALDYAGISVGILGCYVPGVFYAFYCDSVRSAFVLFKLCWFYTLFTFIEKVSQQQFCFCVTFIIRFFAFVAVLEAGVPDYNSGFDSGRVFSSDSPALPLKGMEGSALGYLLLSGSLRYHTSLSLGLA